MRIGVPKEIKDNEYRVALTPAGCRALAAAGHDILVEYGAGGGSGFGDEAYAEAGAALVDSGAAWSADLVVKIKEPLEAEYGYLGPQIVFGYFHLAGVVPSLTEVLLKAGTTAVAYETIEGESGGLPLLAPMSAVAGSMAAIVGNYYLGRFAGGRGILVSRLLGQSHGRVAVLGDGIVGQHAARVAAAMGGHVSIFGLRPDRKAELEALGDDVEFVLSSAESLSARLPKTDLLIGAVLVLGARAPHLVTREMVASMPAGAVVVDVSIDQGGCVETSHPTSHSNPVFVEEGVTHYCVTNMPGAYPRTSTLALTDATLPYISRLAERGIEVFSEDKAFAAGVNTHRGHLTYRAVAESLGMADRYRAFDAIPA